MAVSLSLSIRQNSQSVSNNTSNITVTVSASWTYGSFNRNSQPGTLTIDGTQYSFSAGFNHGEEISGSTNLFQKTVNVAHNSDGSKTVTCSANYITGVSSGTIKASASKTLTKIARASSLTAANGTLGTAQTITISEAVSTYKHRLSYTCGTASGYIAGSASTFSTSNSISWTPPLDLAKQNTTGTSVSITLKLITYTSGGTQVGTVSKTITCAMPASVKPSCTVAVSDPTGYLSTFGSYVQGRSKFKVTVTPTTSYDSAIASYSTTANGAKYTSASFATGTLASSGTLTISATVKDKRGRSGTASKTASVLAYTAPAISKLTVKRCNEDGTENDKGEYVKATFSASATSLSSKNTVAYKLQYKKTSESTYTTVTLSALANKYAVTDSTHVFAADSGSSYDVMLTVTDYFGSVSKSTSASTAFTLMHWHASGKAMGIGKVSETENVLDIGFQTRHAGGLLHPVLEPETDLNDVRTPNTYVGANVTTYNYANCPLTSGTFTLEVVGCGEAGQVKQTLFSCSKTASVTFERFYYQSAWGEWVNTSDWATDFDTDNKLLWSGAYYMDSGHTVTLSEAVSKQKHGIVLVFSRYSDDAAQNYHFSTHFIPKYQITKHGGCGHLFMMSTDGTFGLFAAKYLYIHDTKIVGNDVNTAEATGACGIKYTNYGFVLRYVIGV